jgi:hypothetical protein
MLAPVHLDPKNNYVIRRKVIQLASSECNRCGWRGAWHEDVNAALLEVDEHAERMDGHPSVPDLKKEDISWL